MELTVQPSSSERSMSNNWEELASLAEAELAKATADINAEDGCLASFDSASKDLLEVIQVGMWMSTQVLQT